MTSFEMVKGDLKPSVLATLKYADGTTVDLTSCSATFQMSQGGALLINKPAVILSPPSGGQVRYDWSSGDTNYVGTCQAEFQVTFADWRTMRFPTDGSLQIIFRQEPVPGPPPSPPGYVQVSDVVNALGATFDATNNVYTVYGLTIQAASVQAHTDYANAYVISLLGGSIGSTDPRYVHAVIAAVDIACIRVLVASLGGALVGAYDYFLGDLRVSRAGPYKEAITASLQGFKDDLAKQIVNFTSAVMTATAAAAQDVSTYRGGLINP